MSTSGVEVKMIGVDEVRVYFNAISGKIFAEAKKAYQETTALVHQKVSERVTNGADDSLHSRTGALRRSLVC